MPDHKQTDMPKAWQLISDEYARLLCKQAEVWRECAASLEESHRLLKSDEISGVFLSAHVHGVKISDKLAALLGAAGERREKAVAAAREAGLLEPKP